MRQLAFVLQVLVLACCFSPAQSGSALIRFLQGYVGSDEESKSTQYSAAFVDLKDNGSEEVIVYLSSNGWCGTGGCTMLILAPNTGSYKLVTKIPIVRLPIRMLTTKTNGWHDISVAVGGGGVSTHETRLSFNGSSYPKNPSIPPAERLHGKIAAKIVIPETAKHQDLFK